MYLMVIWIHSIFLLNTNYNKADPLVGDVNMDAQALATGACGTWFMGDWAWTYLADVVEDGAEFGLLPIPHSDDASDVINQSIPDILCQGILCRCKPEY